MMQLEKMLGKLKAEQAKYALESLKQPGEPTEYNLGFKVGVTQGYERAIELIKMILNEETLNERD